MDTSKTKEFRTEFRQGIPTDYSGIRHAGVILAIGALGVGICLYLLKSPLRWWDWLIITVVVLGWNALEWYGHRALHRPGSSAFSKALYKRHALTHHRFFTAQMASLRDTRDLKIVFFPTFALPAIISVSLAPACLLWALVSLNAALLLVATTVIMYLLFEALHLCAHLPSKVWITRLPIINTMCRHHRAHHNPKLMPTTNMNFTLPWADWYFKSCDLDRGFWGTTFNGDSTRHVREKP